jgi:hypothetical protein
LQCRAPTERTSEERLLRAAEDISSKSFGMRFGGDEAEGVGAFRAMVELDRSFGFDFGAA